MIEGNTITEVGFPIHAEQGAAIIRGNHIEHDSSSDTGIQYDDGSGTIEGNTVNGYARGVAVTDFDGAISGNTIDSGFEGVNLTDSTGTVSDNRIKAVFTRDHPVAVVPGCRRQQDRGQRHRRLRRGRGVGADVLRKSSCAGRPGQWRPRTVRRSRT